MLKDGNGDEEGRQRRRKMMLGGKGKKETSKEEKDGDRGRREIRKGKFMQE